MKRVLKLALLVFGFLLLFSRIDGQNLPEYHFKMLQDDTLTFDLFSYTYPYEVAPFPQNGDLDYPSEPPVQNYYPVTYVPDEGFTGIDEFVFQYRGDPGSGYFSWAMKYSRFTIEVLPSVLYANADHVVLNVDSGASVIDVLANDTSTHGGLQIEQLTNIAGGTAIITVDNKVEFTPNPGFDKVAYFNYLVSDAAGSKELGQVSILLVDADNLPETEEIHLATLNTKPLSLLLPANDFELDAILQPTHGELEILTNATAIFTPELDFEGEDSFVLYNDEQQRTYTIEIYDIPNDGYSVVDDKVYTLENEEVIFNVLENDYQDYYMYDWTQAQHGNVNHLGDGEFSYMPNEDYHGFDAFTYTMRVAPIVFQTATVRIGVGNFNPVELEEYQLNTLKNQAIVVNYDIPIEDFTFDVVNDPDYGSLTYYEGFQTIYAGCDWISGYNLLVYEPANDYTGTDEFEVDYCPGDADCRLIKVSLSVLDMVFDPDCPCVENDCVWKGDTNGDGIVDVRDILPIGLYMGVEGGARNYDSEEWIGLNVEDWEGAYGLNELNYKHLDSDGNGLVNALDTASISDNYDKLHTIIPNSVNANKPFPLYISTEQDSVKKGDYLRLTIGIGDELYPVVDINGLSYNLQFPPELIDSSSMIHEFFEDGWFANASSTLQMDKQPYEGKIDAGFTRIGGIGVSGHGPIAKCDFIVEDDIDGLKLKDGIIPVTIKLSGATGMDQYGNAFSMGDAEKTIYIDINEDKEAPKVKELILYPNPAKDMINLHLNGQNAFNRVQVYTSTGLLLDTYRFEEGSNKARLDVKNYNPGVYVVVVETPEGNTAQRFEVIK